MKYQGENWSNDRFEWKIRLTSTLVQIIFGTKCDRNKLSSSFGRGGQ